MTGVISHKVSLIHLLIDFFFQDMLLCRVQLYLILQFLLPWLNRRTDEYGGNLENRVRLLREILEEMKAAIGDTCGIAIRFSSDDLLKVKSENIWLSF